MLGVERSTELGGPSLRCFEATAGSSLRWGEGRVGKSQVIKGIMVNNAPKNPAAANQRILLLSGLISPQLVVNATQQNLPSLKGKVPEGNQGQILLRRPPYWIGFISLDILAKGSHDGS